MRSHAEPSIVYLLGLGVGHSIAPPVHNYISNALGCNWQFEARECPSIEDALTVIRQPMFAGAIVTMPYKKAIMPYLDELDKLAEQLGACNNIYISPDGILRGTNTDWVGVAGCLLGRTTPQKGKPALVVGAGGASKAALYALMTIFECRDIYILNRDDREAADLMREIVSNYKDVNIQHVRSSDEAKDLASPYCIVGTIPDIEPMSAEEMEIYRSLEIFLSQAETKGVTLDMCYKPRRTRILKLAERHSWSTIDGTSIIGHQLQEQYRLWCGEEAVKRMPIAEAWNVLHQAAECSPVINF